jgi:hypothetical protein
MKQTQMMYHLWNKWASGLKGMISAKYSLRHQIKIMKLNSNDSYPNANELWNAGRKSRLIEIDEQLHGNIHD